MMGTQSFPRAPILCDIARLCYPPPFQKTPGAFAKVHHSTAFAGALHISQTPSVPVPSDIPCHRSSKPLSIHSCCRTSRSRRAHTPLHVARGREQFQSSALETLIAPVVYFAGKGPIALIWTLWTRRA